MYKNDNNNQAQTHKINQILNQQNMSHVQQIPDGETRLGNDQEIVEENEFWDLYRQNSQECDFRQHSQECDFILKSKQPSEKIEITVSQPQNGLQLNGQAIDLQQYKIEPIYCSFYKFIMDDIPIAQIETSQLSQLQQDQTFQDLAQSNNISTLLKFIFIKDDGTLRYINVKTKGNESCTIPFEQILNYLQVAINKNAQQSKTLKNVLYNDSDVNIQQILIEEISICSLQYITREQFELYEIQPNSDDQDSFFTITFKKNLDVYLKAKLKDPKKQAQLLLSLNQIDQQNEKKFQIKAFQYSLLKYASLNDQTERIIIGEKVYDMFEEFFGQNKFFEFTKSLDLATFMNSIFIVDLNGKKSLKLSPCLGHREGRPDKTDCNFIEKMAVTLTLLNHEFKNFKNTADLIQQIKNSDSFNGLCNTIDELIFSNDLCTHIKKLNQKIKPPATIQEYVQAGISIGKFDNIELENFTFSININDPNPEFDGYPPEIQRSFKASYSQKDKHHQKENQNQCRLELFRKLTEEDRQQITKLIHKGKDMEKPLYNVLQYLDYKEISQIHYIAMEYYDLDYLAYLNGDLFKKDGMDKKLGYLIDICSGIGELHKLGIPHKNINQETVVLISQKKINPEYKFKIGFVYGSNQQKKMQFKAPELWRGATSVDQYKVDIWAIGMLCFYTLTQQPLFDGSEEDISNHFQNYKDEDIEKNAYLINQREDIRQLICEALKNEPSQRPEAFEFAERMKRIQKNADQDSVLKIEDINYSTFQNRVIKISDTTYKLQEILGIGSEGGVFMAFRYKGVSESKVAFKLQQRMTDHERTLIEKFVKNQDSLENLVKYYEIFPYGKFIVTVLELGQEDLYAEMQTWKSKKQPVSQQIINKIFQDILKGVFELHRMGLIHRDLKPENVLKFPSFSQNIYKLCDLGLIRELSGGQNIRLTKQVGTAYYMAPEMFEFGTYDQKIDIWSLGHIYYELFTGDVLIEGKSFSEIKSELQNFDAIKYKNKINSAKAQFSTTLIPIESRQLIIKMIDQNPNNRPTIGELLNDFKSQVMKIQPLEIQFTVNNQTQPNRPPHRIAIQQTQNGKFVSAPQIKVNPPQSQVANPINNCHSTQPNNNSNLQSIPKNITPIVPSLNNNLIPQGVHMNKIPPQTALLQIASGGFKASPQMQGPHRITQRQDISQTCPSQIQPRLQIIPQQQGQLQDPKKPGQ